jgi:hypothetical protein
LVGTTNLTEKTIMKFRFQLSLTLALVATIASGCAVDTQDEAEDDNVSESELTALKSVEVNYQELRNGMEALRLEVTAPSKFHAFKFTAQEGSKLVAYVVTNNGTDPMAYILDANFNMLKRNDNRDASTKDSEIRFTVPKTGTYHIAFRNRERTPTTFLARLAQAPAGKNVKPTDGWPVRNSTRFEHFQDRANYEANGKYKVLTSGQSTAADGNHMTNYSGCPNVAPRSGGFAIPASGGVVVDTKNNTVALSQSMLGAVRIAADGSFDLGPVKGRVAAGGFVILSEASSVTCSTNYESRRVYSSSWGVNIATAAVDFF